MKRKSAQPTLKQGARMKAADAPKSKQHRSPSSDEAKQKKTAGLAVLVYLCGDCHIEKFTDQYLSSLLYAAPTQNIHLLVQYDTASGSSRYLVSAGSTVIERQEMRWTVKTGKRCDLEEFLEWGLKSVSAEHHVLVLSGLGINPRYVRQSLSLDRLPKQLWTVRGRKPDDPNQQKYGTAFAEEVAQLRPQDLALYRDAIQQRTFSICHDFSNSDSLEITELRDAVISASQHFDSVKKDNRFELILLHAGATAFIEVLYELEGLARVYLGSSDRLPNEGLPFTKILQNWDRSIIFSDHKMEKTSISHHLAMTFLDTIRSERRKASSQLDTFIAVNLDTIGEVARVIDTLAVALLYSIGDWHVLDAVRQTMMNTGANTINVDEPGTKKNNHAPNVLDDVEFVPAADLFDLLSTLEEAFALKLSQRPNDPSSSIQQNRLKRIYRLIRMTIAHLNSQHLLRDSSLLLVENKSRSRTKGLKILLPSLRTTEEVSTETGKIFSLSAASYSKLNFSRRVHWSALVGTVLTIHEKPHALWRMIVSMLGDSTGAARGVALSRLISKQSVVPQLRGQFCSLGDAGALTMSFDFQDSSDKEYENLQVHLESSLGGRTVYQRSNRVRRSALNSIWRSINVLLDEARPMDDLFARLRALGASLGDVIFPEMIESSSVERGPSIKNRGKTPHLTLQMPSEFMRFPWELMTDGKEMLCERYALGRKVSMKHYTGRPSHRASDVIRFLVIGDPSYTTEFSQEMEAKGLSLAALPSARIEAQLIVRALQQLNEEMAGTVELEITSLIGATISTHDMQMYLRGSCFDMIHYAGHAICDGKNYDKSGWVLSDGLLETRDFCNALERSELPPWLIFANASQMGIADAGLNAEPHDLTRMASASLTSGVAAYVGTLWPVDDEIACGVAVGFYRALLRDRYSIGEALQISRMKILDQLRESDVVKVLPAKTAFTWCSFVLFGDPTLQLLHSLWTPTSDRNIKDKTENRPIASTEGTRLANNQISPESVRQRRLAMDLPENSLLPQNVEGVLGSSDAPSRIRTSKANKRFSIALSFPDEHRKFVEQIAVELTNHFGRDRIFYDEWYEVDLLGVGGDLKLQSMYNEAELVIPFFSRYYEKVWCAMEWETIRGILLKQRKVDAVIPVHIDDTQIPGWSDINFGIRTKNRTAKQIATLIIQSHAKRYH